jgi:hypothetical protein
MKYEKPQIVSLPNAVTSVSVNPLLKPFMNTDGAQSPITSVAAYSSDE